MKLTLEKDDLLRLLSIALGYTINSDEVEISTEPFEVRLVKVRLSELASPAKPAAQAVKERVSLPVMPPVETPSFPEEPELPTDLSEELSRSASLVASLPSARIDPDTRGVNDFSRTLADNESEDPPGEDYFEEIGR